MSIKRNVDNMCASKYVCNDYSLEKDYHQSEENYLPSSNTKTMIDIYARYQKGLNMSHLFPSLKNECACGCGQELSSKRKKWSSNECRDSALVQFQIIKGDTDVIREALFSIEHGYCRMCGVYDESWEADHILPVFRGGGACGLDNFQTLCPSCHKEKSRLLDRVPNSNNVFTSSLDVVPPSFDALRAFNNRVSENIIRDTKLLLH